MLGFSNTSIQRNGDQRNHFDGIQKKHVLSYVSGIFMAKYSELKLDQNVLYICIFIWNYQIFICILYF